MRAILELKTITELKKMIRETNIRGYSKLNKKEIINKMLKEDKRFEAYVLKSHKQQQKETAKKEVKKTPVKKLKPKGTHKMPDGSIMSGSVHSKDSKPVKKKIKLTVTKADGTVKELKMKEKKPSAKELTDKAVEKAKARGAKVVRAEPKKAEPKKEEPKKKVEKEDELQKKNKKKQEELIKLLNKNKSKLEKIDYTRTGSRGKYRVSSMYEKYRDEIINMMMFGNDNQVKQRLKSFEKDLKEEIKKAKEKKPSAKELTDKAVEKAKARGAKVVRAEPKKEKVKKFKPIGKYEEIVKEKPRQNLYISSKKDEDDFARLFASLK